MVLVREARGAPVVSALIGCAALAVYSALKVIWAVGGEVGVRDPGEWRAVLGGLSVGQRFGAFWGTVLVDVAGAVLLLALATLRPGPSLLVRAVRLLGWAAGGALTLAGGAGLAVSVGPVIGVWAGAPGDPGPLADWVFVVVYGAFLVVGLAFLVTAALTRPVRQEAT